MTDHELDRIEDLFQRAADLPAEERDAFLDRECDSPPLRARVGALLAQLDRGTALPPPPLGSDPGEAPLTEGPGTIIDRYKLLQRIGEGGFGVVYMAEQETPVVRRVALKVIKLGMDTKEVVARFEAERQALAMMDHPNIARVLDGGSTETGRPYFVMELVRGVSITEYCDQNSLSTPERLALFVDVCLAVQHAHQKGVIHRDIKPTNVMVTLNDGRPLAKVIDFGIAKAMHTRLTEKTLFTEYQRFLGTPAYMSPEQAEMSALDVDTRTDIYSLGVLLYELLTGTTPFDPTVLWERGLAEIQRVIREEPAQRPSLRISTSADATVATRRRLDVSGLTKRVRGDLDWIVMKALEKDRGRRYGTASDFAADVERHLRGEPVAASPPSASYRMSKFVARNRGAVLGTAAVVLALIGGIVGTSVGMVEAGKQRDEARREADHAREVTDFLVETLALTDPDVARVPGGSLRTLLDRAAARVTTAFGARPEAEARLRLTIGRAYESLAEDELAEVHLRRGIGLVDGLENYDQVELYAALWALTHVLFRLEKPDSFTIVRRAREVAHGHVRATHPELAGVLDRFITTIDNAAHSAGEESAREMEATKPLFEEAVRLADARLDEGNPLWPLIAGSYMHAGFSLWYSPFEPISVPFWAEALRIQRRELPPNHPDLAESLAQLVIVLNRSGRIEEAEERIRESVELARGAYPEGSFTVAFSESMLGENLVQQGRFAEAETLLLPAHELIVKYQGDETTFYSSDSITRIVALYEAWGGEEKAAPWRARLAHAGSSGYFMLPWSVAPLCIGPDHADVRAPLERLVEICGPFRFSTMRGEVNAPELEPTVRELVEARSRSLADDDPISIVIARALLPWSNEVSTDAPEARRLMLREVVTILTAVPEPRPLEVAEALTQLAYLEHVGGETDRAPALARESLAWLEEHSDEDGWYEAGAKTRMARCLLRMGLYRDAERLLLASCETLIAQFGEEHTNVKRAYTLAQELYTALGQPDEAAKFADRAR